MVIDCSFVDATRNGNVAVSGSRSLLEVIASLDISTDHAG
jgi:hypothetical protein